ncbi:MAG: dual specificity protein phosphatase [Verrucomicrobiota bacterium]
MDWITKDILIGNYLDAANTDLLKAEGVRSIVSLDGSLCDADYSQHGIELAAFDLIDGAGNSPAQFRRAVDAVAKLRTKAPPLLVHCHAGRSRSPIVVASHFIRDCGLSLSEAMKLISEKREVIVTAGLQEVLGFEI